MGPSLEDGAEPDEPPKPKEDFQEWSKSRLRQIQELSQELDKLLLELVEAHECCYSSPRSSSSTIIGPSSRPPRVPKISACVEETMFPVFEHAEPPPAPPAPPASRPEVKRNSFRKMTPHLPAMSLGDIEESSEGSVASSRRRRGSEFSQRTEGMEALSSTNRTPELAGVLSPIASAQISGVNTSSPATEQASDLRSRATTKDRILVPPSRLGRLVNSQFFDIFYSVAIILNCMTMGLQADMLVNEYAPESEQLVMMAENILVVLFTIEIFARVWVYGCTGYFALRTVEGWMNLMDAIIVLVSGVIFGWVFPLIAWISGQDISAGFLRTISVLRAMRLLRIVRVIQRMPMFREVWLLLRGLTSSLRTLVWTVAVIFVLTYLFAILGCWLIGAEMKNAMDSITDQVELDELLATYKYVKGIAPLMQLLIQFLTLDSWNHKMERIMEYAPWCLGYFYTYIAVAVFVLMNLVTAIIVENAMSASKMDEDQRLKQMEDLKRKELKELEHLFYLMDADGDGTLDWEEFENAFMDEDMSRKWRLLDFQPEECKELFDLLDDGDGGIETKEFFHGLARMKGGAQSRDLIRVAQKVDRLGRDVSSLVQAFCLGCAAGSISGSETLGNPVSGADARFIQVRPETPGGRRMSVAIRPGRREQRSGSDIDAIGPKNGGKSPKSPKVGLEEAKRRMASMGRDAVEKGYGSEASGYSGSAVSGASALSDSR